ncbi:hypothetical protein DFH29DRAFT_998014 [Suillus ampliporus]|nr:hypothetical protein DFH29DRAFT_998014 [Suillus ampliporus]
MPLNFPLKFSGDRLLGHPSMSTPGYTCICKRTFSTQNHFSQHQRSCSHTKKRLSSAISSLKEFVSRRKRMRTLNDAGPGTINELPNRSANSPVIHLASGEVNASNATIAPPDSTCSSVAGIITGDCEVEEIEDEEDLSLAQCRLRRQNRQMPKQFRDVLPVPPPTVPAEVRELPPAAVGEVVTSDASSALLSRSMFRTPPNIFGLVRQYFSSTLPSHDPDEYVTLADLSFIPGSSPVDEVPNPPAALGSDTQYHPYPNRSSFKLGDWYWNQGVQKSQRDFVKLVDILGDSTFSCDDVSSTHWKNINSQLGLNEYDEEDGVEWEDKDAGWQRTPVSINVPFSHTTDTPGPRVYQAADLYHRSLVSVIREKIANARDSKLFHYEPYELCWHPPHLDAEVPIYGDLYTCPAFHEAHSKLQELPREPGCDLPRVVAGLMFWSDATQLTSFGNAKLLLRRV